jgi:membrane protein DedA with SNARE-associated domain
VKKTISIIGAVAFWASAFIALALFSGAVINSTHNAGDGVGIFATGVAFAIVYAIQRALRNRRRGGAVTA